MEALSNKINLLIIGTGMYVCGRGTSGYGTILPAVMQCYKTGMLGRVFVASRCADSFKYFNRKLKDLKESLGVEFVYTPYPQKDQTNPSAYLKAIEELPDPGAVIVATPDHLHTEMVLSAIKSKKHVLVVKPLTPTVNEAYQLIREADEAGIYGAVEFHKRWDWANLQLRSSIENGLIGDLLYFHIEFSQRKVIPEKFFSAWVDYTNVFQYLGVHYADMIYFVTKDKPLRMIATGQKKYLSKQGISNYDAIQVLIEWNQGFTTSLLTNWVDPQSSTAMSQQKITVVGTNGRFESDQTDRGVQIISDVQGLEKINPYFCQPYKKYDDGYLEYKGYGIESITQFIKDVDNIARGSNAPKDFESIRPTFKESLISTSIVEGVKLSLENDSHWVYFKEDHEPYLKSL